VTGYEPITLQRAKALRRTMTDAEKLLWGQLRDARLGGFKFRKQQPIGPYIADFVCQEMRLILEADGSQHAESDHDAQRDVFLSRKGYRILRFWNNDIMANIRGVKEAIYLALTGPHPPTAARRAPPSPSRGEGFGEANV
jgi:very-short-patch-repair endonuclease